MCVVFYQRDYFTAKDEDVIHCANRHCVNGRYFHLSCVGLREGKLPSYFYCSDDCEATSYDHCCGRKDIEDIMVGCDNASKCPNGEWFHRSCVGLDDKTSE